MQYSIRYFAFLFFFFSHLVFAKPYLQAIKDAAVPETHEVSKNLIPIHNQNDDLIWRTPKREELLVVTWKSESTYQKYFAKPGEEGRTSSNERYVVWVTAAPEVQKSCQKFGRTGKTLSKRIKQYLGLSTDWQYDRFIEMWVSPQDLFRPCPDPDIQDKQCSLKTKGKPNVSGIANYPRFFNSLFPKSYQEQGAPWTRLGYTYDWGNPNSEIGASEFILAPGTSYEVASAKKPMSTVNINVCMQSKRALVL